MVLLPNGRDAGTTRHALTRMFPLPGSTGAEADLVNRVPGRRRFVNAVNLALDRGRQSWRRAGEWRTSNTSENASVCSKRRTGFTFIRFVSTMASLRTRGSLLVSPGLDLRCRLTPGPVIAGIDRSATAACCRIRARAGGFRSMSATWRAPHESVEGHGQRPRQVAGAVLCRRSAQPAALTSTANSCPRATASHWHIPIARIHCRLKQWEFFTRLFPTGSQMYPGPRDYRRICTNADATDSDPVSPREPTQEAQTMSEKSPPERSARHPGPSARATRATRSSLPRRAHRMLRRRRVRLRKARHCRSRSMGNRWRCCRSSRAASSRSACPIGATSRRSTSRATSSISTPHFVAAERPLRWRPPRLPASTRRTQQ